LRSRSAAPLSRNSEAAAVSINDEGNPHIDLLARAIDPATGQSGARATLCRLWLRCRTCAGVGAVCTQASTMVDIDRGASI
jgi:hypothetical protein